MRYLGIAAVLFLALASPALAWNEAGHKIVASIAFRRLTEDEQQKVIAILNHHPRFKDDFLDKLPAEIQSESRNEWLFHQASVWPDIVRGFPDDLKLEFHRGPWHYINVPHFLTEADRGVLQGQLTVNFKLESPSQAELDMNVIQTIRYARSLLAREDAPLQEKALMLAWLFHTVGDIHQPLHSTALFSRELFPEGDRGGNSISTTPSNSMTQSKNLHAVWDGFPGKDGDFTTARNRAVQYLGDPTSATLGDRASPNLDEAAWLEESRGLAINAVYDDNLLACLRNLKKPADNQPLPPITLTDEYLQAGQRICERRVVEAGYRLGAILKQVVK